MLQPSSAFFDMGRCVCSIFAKKIGCHTFACFTFTVLSITLPITTHSHNLLAVMTPDELSDLLLQEEYLVLDIPAEEFRRLQGLIRSRAYNYCPAIEQLALKITTQIHGTTLFPPPSSYGSQRLTLTLGGMLGDGFENLVNQGWGEVDRLDLRFNALCRLINTTTWSHLFQEGVLEED
ncbi:hypothetical protein HOY80DRAFT_1140393 [Tuber brumale]|nr:hypothetical protein HOY80DRAFT_1140393 [Tuber brumale]